MNLIQIAHAANIDPCALHTDTLGRIAVTNRPTLLTRQAIVRLARCNVCAECSFDVYDFIGGFAGEQTSRCTASKRIRQLQRHILVQAIGLGVVVEDVSQN